MPFPVNGILDNANRADEGPPPSANWTTEQLWNNATWGGINVTSNRFKGATSSSNFAYWSAQQFGPDCEVFADIGTQVDTVNGSIFARLTTPGDSTTDGYMAQIDWNSAGDIFRLYRIDAGVRTQLDTANVNTANGDGIGLECIGSAIKVYHRVGAGSWTQVISVVDATYGAAGYIGLGIRAGTPRMDNFGGGTIASAPVGRPGDLLLLGVA